MKKIAIFASGTGTNAAEIIRYFSEKGNAKVGLLVTNRVCPAVEKAMMLDVPVMILDKKSFFADQAFTRFLLNQKIDLIVLAGFLLLIPPPVIGAFRGRILNIHPALLPKHGGKGMFGNKVHESVLKSGDPESGITIHQVDEQYDSGDLVFQTTCRIEPGETAETLADKVHLLEHQHYPRVIEEFLYKLP